MKTETKFKTLLITLFFLIGVTTTQAQFFEKLQKKAEEKIAREAEKRAERRVNKKIDKTFDNAETGIDGTVKRKPKNKNEAELPTKYSFNWKITMNIESSQGNLNMHYLIKQDASYFATILEMKQNKDMKNMVSIMDFEHQTITTLMDMQGNKVKRVMDIPDNDDYDDNEKINIVETDTKTILGYLCQGYKMDTKEGLINMYVAVNAPVSFNRTLSSLPGKGKINPNVLKKLKNGLMLEMTFVSHKNKKHNMKMICTALKKEKRTLNTKSYKSFGF